jgi:hypothetical protein
MKNKLIYGIVILLCSCSLPDFKSVNPTRLLDAPAFNITTSGPHVKTVNGINYLEYGQSADVTIAVTDAPGKIADISGGFTIPAYGTITPDDASVNAVKGSETGSAKIIAMATALPSDGADRNTSISVSVVDSQVDDNGNPVPKTTTNTIPVVFVKCLGDGMATGIYEVTAANGVLDGGAAYTLDDIESTSGKEADVVITSTRPGKYTFSEITGGVWPTFYSTRASPVLDIDLCDKTINGHGGAVTTGLGTTAQRKFTINGTLNNDGTITITWSYVRETAATPVNPANGTYTLTKK